MKIWRMRKVTNIWKQKDGTKIRICDMTDSHLKNSIKYLEKRAMYIKDHYPFPCFGGEMAQYCAEQEFFAAMEASVDDFFPIYSKLKEEELRRQQ